MDLVKEEVKKEEVKTEDKMTESVFIINKSNKDILETKPDIGQVLIPANGEYEARDIMGEYKTPENKFVPYVRMNARAFAESIVRDYGKPEILCLKEDREKVEKEIRTKLEKEISDKENEAKDKEFRAKVEKEVKDKMEAEKKEKELKAKEEKDKLDKEKVKVK